LLIDPRGTLQFPTRLVQFGRTVGAVQRHQEIPGRFAQRSGLGEGVDRCLPIARKAVGRAQGQGGQGPHGVVILRHLRQGGE
jgi:hypothetical protein